MADKTTQEKRYLLSVLSRNHSGVLLRVAGLFSRRGYSILSIVAAQTENPEVSQMIIAVQGDDRTINQVEKQLLKLVDILQVKLLDSSRSVVREHLLIKVEARPENFGSLIDIANMFKANLLDVSENTVIFELTGETHTLDSFVQLCKPHRIKRMIRTGCSAMERGDPLEEELE